MSALETFLVSRFMVFTLVLARTGALVMTAPIFGSQALPRQVRALLAVAMSLLVTPVYLSTSVPPVDHMLEYRPAAGERSAHRPAAWVWASTSCFPAFRSPARSSAR